MATTITNTRIARTFDHTEEGGLKVNLNQINLDDAQGIMAELTELMGEIRANG